MHISFRNWLVGATVDVNTAGAVNAAGAVAQFNGDPVGFKTPTGILGFSLGASRRIRCLAFADCRGGGGTFRVRVRSGGAAGTIVKTWGLFSVQTSFAAYNTVGPYNVYDTSSFDVTGDYVSIECTGRSNSVYPASSADYTQIGRIWVGDKLPMTMAETANMTEIDNTTIEQSGTGEEFFTEGRTRREITSPSVTVVDNLALGSAATDGDYEDWLTEMRVASSEVLLYAHDEFDDIVHGQLAEATIRKAAGPNYVISPFTVGGM